jgi:hypothetical protein
MNYNKNPLECIKIFEKLIQNKQQKVRYQIGNPNILSIEPNQNFHIDHNLQILKFQKTQEKKHPCERQNYGIELNRPEFIRFNNFTRRLKNEIMMDDKNVDIFVEKNKEMANPRSIQLLGKRSSNNFALRGRNHNMLNSENNSESNNSFFGSTKSIAESNNFFNFFIKSLDDKNKFPKILDCMFFNSTNNKKISRLSETEEQQSQRNESSNFMIRILEQIRMVDLNEKCDKTFRESILKMMRRYANGTQ